MNQEEFQVAFEKLTAEEKQVFNYRREGKTVGEIAILMDCSESLISNKFNPNIHRAFGAKNWPEVLTLIGDKEVKPKPIKPDSQFVKNIKDNLWLYTFTVFTIGLFIGGFIPWWVGHYPLYLLITRQFLGAVLVTIGATAFITQWLVRRK